MAKLYIIQMKRAKAKAHRFVTWCRAAAGDDRAIRRCQELGIPIVKSDNPDGAFLGPLIEDEDDDSSQTGDKALTNPGFVV